MGILGACYLAIDVDVPSPAPDFALKAGSIYRIEIGLAAFAGFYLMVMTFVLALGGRGFTEIGTKGLRAQEVVNRKQQTAMHGQDRSIKAVRHALLQIQHSLPQIDERIKALEKKRN